MFKKNTLRRMLLLLALAAIPGQLLAQSLNDRYTFSSGTDPTLWSPMPASYTPILQSGIISSGDGVTSNAATIGFLFYYAGTSYGAIRATDDGSLCLDHPGYLGNAYYYTPILDSIHPLANHYQGYNKINGFGHNGYIGQNNYVRCWLDSSASNLRFIVEFCLAEVTDTTKQLKYQVQLEQNTNNITFVYAANTANVTAGSNYQPGITYEYAPCPVYSNVEAYFIDVANDTVEYVPNNCTLYNAVGTWPAANRYYRFSYISESAYELPYYENFESAWDWCDSHVSGGISRMPAGWKIRNVGGMGEWVHRGYFSTRGPQIYYYPYRQESSFWLQVISNYEALMPRFNRKLSSLKLSLDYHNYGLQTEHPVVAAAYEDTLIILDTIPNIGSLQHYVLYFSQFDSILSLRDTSHVRISFFCTGEETGKWIDNIRVELAPDCAPPSRLHVDAKTQHTATLSWKTNGGTEWTVAYDTLGVAYPQHTLTVTDTNRVTLNNLVAGKAYDCYIWADCYGTTDTVHIRFATDAAPVETLPYHTGFEDGEDQSWSFSNAYLNKWYVDTAISASGERSMYISYDQGTRCSFSWYYDTIQYHDLANIGLGGWSFSSRTVHVTTPGVYSLAYDWICWGSIRHNAYLGAFLVPANIALLPDSSNGIIEHQAGGIYTIEAPQGWIDMCDVGGATETGDSTMNYVLEWTTYEGTATIADTGLYNIVFVWRNSGHGETPLAGAIDNVWFGLNTCAAAEGLQIDHLTYDSVILSWTPTGTATQWIVGIEGLGEFLTTNTTYTMTGLQTGVTYSAYVQASCGNADISRPTFVKFTTPCEAQQLPYYENFDNFERTSAWTNKLPDCWNFKPLDAEENWWYYPNYHPQVYMDTETEGVLSLYHEAVTMLPPVEAPMNTLQIDFNAMCESSYSRLIVGVMEGQRFVPYDTVSFTPSTAYTHTTLYMGDYTGTGNRIAFRNQWLRNQPSDYDSLAIKIDSLAITLAPACVEPTNLQLSSRLHNSASVYWHANGSTAWEVEYGPTGFTPGNGIVDTVYTSAYTMTNLAPLTTYDCRVSTICSDGSADTATITFTTRNTPVTTLPYYTGFETGDDTNWELRNGANGWYIGGATSYASSNSLYISSNNGATNSYTNTISRSYALRDFVINTPGDYTVAFDWHCQGELSTNYMRVFLVPSSATIVTGSDNGIISGGTPEGWINVGIHNNYYQMAMQGEWTHFETTVTLDSTQLDTWTLAFCFFNGRYYLQEPPAAVDNIVFGIISCEQPTNITLDSASGTSLSFHWTDNSDPQLWEVYVNNQLAGTTTSSYYTATGLQSSTDYTIAVRGICGPGDTSFFARTVLTTECGVHLLTVDNPLFEDFESATPPPLCWSIVNTSVDNPIIHTTSKAYSGSRSLRFSSYEEDSYDDYDQYLISPELNCTDSIYLSFMAQRYSGGDDLRIGYSTTTPDLSSMTWRSWLTFPSSNTWHQFRDTLPPDTKYIALHYYGDYYYYVYVDSLTISTDALNCFTPVVTDTTTTYRSIDIAWTLSDSTEIVIIEGTTFDETVPAVVSTAGSYSFTGLTPSTTYIIGLRGICDSIHYTDWNIFTVTTDDLECVAPASVTATAGFTSVHISWVPFGSEEAWQVHVFDAAGYDILIPATIAEADLGNLSQGWAYSVQVRPMCGDDNEVEGPWSDTVFFATNTCEPPTDVAVTATATTAIVSWAASVNSTGAYNILYGPAEFLAGDGITVSATGTSHTLTDLEPETDYDVYVNSVCDGDVVSIWTTVYNFTTDSLVGIADVDGANSVSLYPNPTNNKVTLAVKDLSGEATVSIVDMNGREAMHATMSERTLTLDVSRLPKGAYFLRLTGEHMNVIRKLLIL